ncbi:MAG: hypothetical protein ACI4WG_02010 [Erysipelotrichaceae bacterium]
MRKNTKKLIIALVTLVLILGSIIYFAPKMNDSVKLDLELSQGNSLVFSCDSTDQQTVQQAAEVLENRLFNFGAIDVESKIDGNKITLSFTGDFDYDSMRQYITKKGEISFRDATDREVMGSDVLVSTMPFGVSMSGDTTLLYIFVSDTAQFGATTLSLSLLENNNLVIWLDYDESMSYVSENEKDEPAYLASAVCSSAISETCYVVSAHDFDTTKNLVSVANGGMLPCTISEESFTLATSAANSQANTIIAGLWISVALASLVLIYSYKLTGLVSSVLLVGYNLLAVNIASAFSVIFNSNVVTMLVFGLFIMIAYLLLFDHNFNQLYQAGNTVNNSLKNSFKKLSFATVCSALFIILTITVTYMFFKTYFLGVSITGFAIVFSFVIAVLLQYFILNNLYNSNYLAKNLISKNNPSKYSLVKFNYKSLSLVSYVLLALCFVGFIVFVMQVKDDYLILIYGLIPVAVATLLMASYYYLSDKKVLAHSTVIQVLFSLFALTSVLVITSNATRANISAVAMVTSLVSALSLLCNNLLYSCCAKSVFNGKSASKAVNALNNAVTEYKRIFIVLIGLMFVTVVVTLGFAGVTDKFVVALLFSLTAVLSLVVTLTAMYSYAVKH